MHNESEFYVGYLPMPAGLKKTILRVVMALAVVSAGAAVMLVVGQHPFAEANFEFQRYREFRGTLIARPYPALAIPGQGLPWLLVRPGKYGAADMRSLDGQEVKFTGARIIRGGDHMIEMAPGTLTAGGAGVPAQPPEALGEVQLTGEIVDSKCYLGVMNPGDGKVHRDCAVRCISGGIPPAFLVRDSSGNLVTVLLANWKRVLLDHVAEPVTIRGHLSRSAGRLTLYQE
jgi:hypothetical protein